ncbi:MAG: TraM recognition domain-containing protein [Nitrospiraceae bacterium]|nr:TraM recognition domain-containing protein [Nitrospiraceae bacterium]
MFKNKEPGIILGRGQALANPAQSIEIAVPDSHRNGHLWCFGTTRVGKTRVIENMAEQDIRKGHSVVLIDPKGDLEIFSKIVQVAFEEGRQEDLMLVTPIFPDYSAIVDPLAYYFMPEELVGHIVSGVEVGKEKFFYNVAYEISLVVVQALILKARSEGNPPRFNLNDVKNRISQADLKELKDQIDGIETAEAEQLRADMQKILNSPTDYYGKVSSSLRVALMELTSGNIGKVIGKADENRFLKRLEEGKRVIMVVQLGSLLTRRAAYTLGKVVISMVQSFVGRVFASGRKVMPPLCLYIDEAQNVLYYGIDDLFAKAGGAGVWVHGFSQSVSQLYAALGEDYANVILDNTNTKLFMRVPDAKTAQYVADHFGERTKFAPILSVGGGMTARSMEEPVLKPADILNLPARKFYLMGYGGSFVGRTADISKPYVRIKFPNLESGAGGERTGDV